MERHSQTRSHKEVSLCRAESKRIYDCKHGFLHKRESERMELGQTRFQLVQHFQLLYGGVMAQSGGWRDSISLQVRLIQCQKYHV